MSEQLVPPYRQGREPHPAVAAALECLEGEERQRNTAERRYYTQLYKAIMLSPTLEVCEALLRGENVPLELLNADQVRRFGLR